MTDVWDNSYFDGLIVSKNIKRTFKATGGVMHKGELPKDIEANAGREQITVKTGTLLYKARGSTGWTVYSSGESFIIPSGTRFTWKVEMDRMEYDCVYLDQVIP